MLPQQMMAVIKKPGVNLDEKNAVFEDVETNHKRPEMTAMQRTCSLIETRGIKDVVPRPAVNSQGFPNERDSSGKNEQRCLNSTSHLYPDASSTRALPNTSSLHGENDATTLLSP